MSELLNAAIPTDDGKVEEYGPLFWRPAFTDEGYPEGEPKREPTEATVALTDQSIVFVPRTDAGGVIIPYAAVLDVQPSAKSNSVMIIKSVCGRFDIVTFWHPQASTIGPEMAKTATATIRSRMRALH